MELLKHTPDMFNRAVRDFRKGANENVTVRWISGVYYVFGSELATLRLLKLHRNCDRARQAYSVNLNTFYFSLEVPNFDGPEIIAEPSEGFQVTT